jgi:hypothetical protein
MDVPTQPVGYDSWARRKLQLPEAAPGVWLAGVPPPDFRSWIAKAREQGVRRIVTGFLPDEVDATGDRWSDDLEFLLQRLEFLPFQLEAEFDKGHAAAAAPIVHVGKGSCHSSDEPLSLTFARIWSGLTGRTWHRVRADEVTEDQLAAEVAAAGGVVNDVDAWDLGFAIDMLARRRGVTVIRLRNPGYSPVRHALLGLSVPPLISPPGGVCRLRPLIPGDCWQSGTANVTTPDVAWLEGGGAGARWRELLGVDLLADFWSDTLAEAGRLIRPRGAEGWLHRPAAWALLARLVRVEPERGIGASAVQRVLAVVAQWLATEQRLDIKGYLRDRAVARWIRLCPEWISEYQREAGNTRETAVRIGLGVQRGMRWKDCPTPLERFFECAWMAIDPATPTLGLACAWRDRWNDVPAALSGLRRDPTIRFLCLAAWRERLNEISKRGVPAGAERLLHQWEPWAETFGAGADHVRFLTAVRCRKLGAVRDALRDGAVRRGTDQGWGLLRLIRIAKPPPVALDDWLRELVAAPSNNAPLAAVELVRSWLAQRRWSVWRRRRAAGVMAELAAAADILQAAVHQGISNPWILALQARLAALSGREERAVAALEALRSTGESAEQAAGGVALAFWLHGQLSAAARVLSTFPAKDDPPKALFEHAVVWQLLGTDPARLVPLVAALRAKDPHFLRGEGSKDGRHAWLAVMAEATGNESLADVAQSRAVALDPTAVELIQDEPRGRARLDESWSYLLPEETPAGRTAGHGEGSRRA